MRKSFAIRLNLGSLLAAGLSYAINKSIWWALFHCFLGWIYLAYQFALIYLVK